ncbi:MAG: tRNA guanosine(34) transglycosylase Tgt [Nanoarchaeota archaeon]|nr:tRNA guanosine(34) transglycosylase Tgt [Nanoarchaeota archaeon]MBU0977858.1 tRNA guanosine(34) transglycosylase Tgt [Nanoarchaeota archaeon]
MKPFKITSKSNKARTGIFTTRTGQYETPFFMPVATKAAVKYLDAEELEEISTQSIISNAFLLYLKPGLDVIKKHKGLHNFMNWKNCIFTDSGGFQVLSLNDFKDKFSDKGLKFKSPFDGSLHELTPKKVMEIEQTLGSDVAMCLDQMPLYSSTYEQVKEATARTHLFAKQCIKYHKGKSQLLFGIAQGGTFPDLRKQSAQFISNLPFDGIALGGLAVGEPLDKMKEMIKISIENMPEEKPKYLMGVGSPKEIIEAVEQGIDIFDSVWPTRNARHGKIFTSEGYLEIEKSQNKNSPEPLEKNCNCKVCKTYTCAYLHHLFKTNEPTGKKLLSYHNLYFLQDLMRKIRGAIKEGKFKELKDEYSCFG